MPPIVSPRRCVVIVLLAGLLCSCELLDNTPETASDCSGQQGVVADASQDMVDVLNCTNAPIYTFIVGRDTAALILWAPSVDGDGLEEGARAAYPIDDILGGTTEEELIVFWWHSRIVDGERTFGTVGNVLVPL